MTTDPLGLAADVAQSTTKLFATTNGLTDESVARPSLLPGWTRGHVLTHLARNADGAVNLLTWARTGVRTPQYESLAQRAADIEAGATRDRAAQLSDLRGACVRFAAAVDEMPAEAWTAVVQWTSGREAPAAEVMWHRLREVEIHHVDLDAGYVPADWPEAFVLRLCRTQADSLAHREDGPAVVLRAPEVGHDLVIGDGPVVSGPAWAIAAWLTGRTTGHELTLTPAGPLPAVPPFG
jgi:maleylpyruvate isomerase